MSYIKQLIMEIEGITLEDMEMGRYDHLRSDEQDWEEDYVE